MMKAPDEQVRLALWPPENGYRRTSEEPSKVWGPPCLCLRAVLPTSSITVVTKSQVRLLHALSMISHLLSVAQWLALFASPLYGELSLGDCTWGKFWIPLCLCGFFICPHFPSWSGFSEQPPPPRSQLHAFARLLGFAGAVSHPVQIPP